MTTIDHTAGLAVETRGLTQTFGSTNALESVDLTVRPGTITGLIGRNGAGKSTLVSLIACAARARGRCSWTASRSSRTPAAWPAPS